MSRHLVRGGQNIGQSLRWVAFDRGDGRDDVILSQYDVIPAVVAVEGDPAQAVTDILSAPDKMSAHLGALVGLSNRPGQQRYRVGLHGRTSAEPPAVYRSGNSARAGSAQEPSLDWRGAARADAQRERMEHRFI